MKKYISTKRVLVAFAAILFLFACYGCTYFYYHARTRMKATSTVCILGGIREAFFKFRDAHRRWPRSMEEIYGTETSDGPIRKEYDKDSISDKSFRCVTEKNWYYKIGTEKPYKVLVILPQSYRTELWPFGEMRTIIASYSGVHYISPSEIIDMRQVPPTASLPVPSESR